MLCTSDNQVPARAGAPVVKMVNSVLKFTVVGTRQTYHYINQYISWSTIMAQVRHGSACHQCLTSIGAIVTFFLSFILSFFLP